MMAIPTAQRWICLFLGAASIAMAAINPGACRSNASYTTVDSELNGVYKKVMQRFGEDTARVRGLKAAQREWLKFRDLEAVAFSKSSEGGSLHDVCVCGALERLQRERVAQLKLYLEGEEGDGCAP